ncbi:MAG TPA: hypothetical protein VME69_15970 [Methylocella sp.]|nr:hypothetical protein [Methylocella sp.]
MAPYLSFERAGPARTFFNRCKRGGDASPKDGRTFGIFDSNKSAILVFDAKSENFYTAPNRALVGKPSLCAARHGGFVGQCEKVRNNSGFVVANNLEREYWHPVSLMF